MNSNPTTPCFNRCKAAFFLIIALGGLLTSCSQTEKSGSLPPEYGSKGAFIKTLPYFNPDSCVVLIKKEVPLRWQGAAYENLFLNGPEDSPLALGFQHLDYYEKYFPADSARAFSQLWRGRLVHPDSAAPYLQESYDISMRLKNYIRAGDAKEALGIICYNTGKTVEALRYFLEVHEAVARLGESQNERKVNAMANIANTYHQSRNFDEALAWTKRMLPLVEDESKEQFRWQKVNYFKNCGMIYIALNQPDSAILMFQKAMDLQEQYQTLNSRVNLESNIAFAYLKKGDCAEALRHYRKINWAKSESIIDLEGSYLSLAECYFCLGMLDSAEMLNLKFLESANPIHRSVAKEQLSKVYEKKGMFLEAYKALSSSLDLRQKNFNIETVQEIGASKVALQMEREKLLAERKLQEHTNKIQKALIFSLSLLMVLGLVSFLFSRSKTKNKILEQKILLTEAREALKVKELEKTRGQLQTTAEELKTTSTLLLLKTQLFKQWERRAESLNLRQTEDGAETANKGIQILTSSDWENYQKDFEAAFPGLIAELRTQFTTLTNSETRIFLLLKTGLTNNEIANVIGISTDSVWKTRHRLKKKLNQQALEDLDAFVKGFGNNVE